MRTRITERDLSRIVRRVINEGTNGTCQSAYLKSWFEEYSKYLNGDISKLKGTWEMSDINTIVLTLESNETITIKLT